MKENKDKKELQRLLHNDPAFETGKVYLDFRQLDVLGNDILRSGKCMRNAWSGEQTTPWMYPVDGVQALFNFAREAVMILQTMKVKMIEGGLAYYGSDGKFYFKEENDKKG